ncbi:hypothetical protein [Nocardia sp. NPDC050175]|uniref:hypothetical protein n=1 Tax=Nocardia sp. NPDC050175 TaxID=3364317 RepID=UPI00379D1818
MLFRTAWRRAFLIGVSGSLMLGGAASPATASPASEARDQVLASFVTGFMCAGGGKTERSARWYVEFPKIQDSAPYDTGGIRIFSTAADAFNRDPILKSGYVSVKTDGSGAFNPYSRQRICEDLPAFVEMLALVRTDQKGDLTTGETEDRMTEFFDQKAKKHKDLVLREDPEGIEEAISYAAKLQAEQKAEKKLADMNENEREDADRDIENFTAIIQNQLALTPEIIARAKADQPEEYKLKVPCNPDAKGNCRV